MIPNQDGFVFSVDWFAANIPAWTLVIEKFRPHKILEIGAFEGRSTCFMIEHCSRHGRCDIDVIDTWEGGAEHKELHINMRSVESVFDHNVAVAGAGAEVRLRKLKGTSDTELVKVLAEPDSRQSYDLIYIDGSHEAPDVLQDAVLCFPLLKKGGILIFDDYFWGWGNDPLRTPKLAIDAFTTIYQRQMHAIPGMPSLQLYLERVA